MSDILNFVFCEIAHASSADPQPPDQRTSFPGLTPNERIARCRELTAEAERLAVSASGDAKREAYLDLARQWSTLADEMETAQSGAA